MLQLVRCIFHSRFPLENEANIRWTDYLGGSMWLLVIFCDATFVLAASFIYSFLKLWHDIGHSENKQTNKKQHQENSWILQIQLELSGGASFGKNEANKGTEKSRTRSGCLLTQNCFSVTWFINQSVDGCFLEPCYSPKLFWMCVCVLLFFKYIFSFIRSAFPDLRVSCKWKPTLYRSIGWNFKVVSV